MKPPNKNFDDPETEAILQIEAREEAQDLKRFEDGDEDDYDEEDPQGSRNPNSI